MLLDFGGLCWCPETTFGPEERNEVKSEKCLVISGLRNVWNMALEPFIDDPPIMDGGKD